MIGEISISGVYVPTLLVFACLAAFATAFITRLLSMVGFYRAVAYRPVVDIAFFLLLLALFVWVTASWGLHQ
jgi:hypothetical protein